ncbi:MAG TPA: hypothetical protein VEC16_02745 [Alphaproteobacteria bacterium]|nr:hypothetical protein [Alphaproteobacteria bacterium]
MNDDADISWNRTVTLIFVVSAIIVLTLLVFFIFLLPILQQ